MQALEIGHFRRVSGLHQRLIPRHDKRGQAAAEHGLLAEQVGLAFLAEGGLDDAGPAAADRAGVGQRQIVAVPRGILMDRQQHRHAGAALVFRAHRVSRPLRRDHEDIQVLARLDQVEVDVQAMCKSERRAFAHVRFQMVAIERPLVLVRRQNHDDIGPFRRFARVEDLETRLFGLGRAGGAGTESDSDIFRARIAKINRMRVSLTPVTDNGHFLRFHQIHVGITIIIDPHGRTPFYA